MGRAADQKARKAKQKAAKDGSGRVLVASNRKARYDYHIDDTYEAGIALMGTGDPGTSRAR